MDFFSHCTTTYWRQDMLEKKIMSYSEYLYTVHDMKACGDSEGQIIDNGIKLSNFMPSQSFLGQILRLSPHIKE